MDIFFNHLKLFHMSKKTKAEVRFRSCREQLVVCAGALDALDKNIQHLRYTRALDIQTATITRDRIQAMQSTIVSMLMWLAPTKS